VNQRPRPLIARLHGVRGPGVGVFWLFVLPFASLTAVFGVWPILLSLQVSMTASATALQPSAQWVGWANYATVLADPLFVASLGRTLVYTALAVVCTIVLALAYALLLHSPLIGRGLTFFKIAIFLPVVTPDVAGYVVWRWLFDQSFGAVNVALGALGLPPFGGLSDPGSVLWAVLAAELWHHAGFYMVEAEKARAARQLAEMRIAQAQADQAAARLGLVRHRLAQATLKAPFDGIVAEGDLRQRISAPVRQGDALLKVARIDRLYVEVEVHERDVQDVLAAKAAEIAFVAQPRSTFAVNVAVVEPSAQPKEEGNVFRLRATLALQPEAWFRPGMSGVCKVPSGTRTLAWILAHRTIDFLRMYLWW